MKALNRAKQQVELERELSALKDARIQHITHPENDWKVKRTSADISFENSIDIARRLRQTAPNAEDDSFPSSGDRESDTYIPEWKVLESSNRDHAKEKRAFITEEKERFYRKTSTSTSPGGEITNMPKWKIVVGDKKRARPEYTRSATQPSDPSIHKKKIPLELPLGKNIVKLSNSDIKGGRAIRDTSNMDMKRTDVPTGKRMNIHPPDFYSEMKMTAVTEIVRESKQRDSRNHRNGVFGRESAVWKAPHLQDESIVGGDRDTAPVIRYEDDSLR